MTSPLSLDARKARLGALRDVIDASGGGRMLCYEGLVTPLTPETDTTDTLLCTLLLAATSGVVGDAGGVATLTLSVPRAALAATTGVVGWVRLDNGLGEGILDMLASEVPGTTPVVLSDTQVYAGGELQLVTCVIAE